MFKKLVLYPFMAVLGVAILAAGIGGGYAYREYKKIVSDPTMPSLEGFDQVLKVLTKVLDREGELICEIGSERRVVTSYAGMNKFLIDAFVAIEDERFWEHDGVDLRGLARAYYTNWLGHRKQGASTITMQLVKNLFLSSEKRDMWYKKRQIVLAYSLEEWLARAKGSKRAAKETIIERYLNLILFDRGRYGVEAASQYYFGKSAANLTLVEAAALAALPKDPSRYNPRRHPEINKKRRALVLANMLRLGRITSEQYSEALGATLTIVPDVKPYGGAGQEVCDQARISLSAEHCAKLDLANSRDRQTCDGIISGLGQVVRSTISLRLQAQVGKFLANGLAVVAERHGRNAFPQGAVVLIDNATGEILAIKGGSPYFAGGFDRAFGKRQPGSLMKAFVYAAGLKTGAFGPNTIFVDQESHLDPRHQEKIWPSNYEPEFMGAVTVTVAFAHSINTVAVQAIARTGVDNVIATARALGVKSELGRDLSLALGTSEVTPMEIAGAYRALAMGGEYLEPMLFAEIGGEKRNLRIRTPSQAVPPVVAAEMSSLFHEVVSNGTGVRARGRLPEEAGGKTGTTSGHSDAWFAGFTKRFTCVVWVGYDKRISLGNKETGAAAALPIWLDTMHYAYTGKPAGAVYNMSRKKIDDTVKEEDNNALDEFDIDEHGNKVYLKLSPDGGAGVFVLSPMPGSNPGEDDGAEFDIDEHGNKVYRKKILLPALPTLPTVPALSDAVAKQPKPKTAERQKKMSGPNFDIDEHGNKVYLTPPDNN